MRNNLRLPARVGGRRPRGGSRSGRRVAARQRLAAPKWQLTPGPWRLAPFHLGAVSALARVAGQGESAGALQHWAAPLLAGRPASKPLASRQPALFSQARRGARAIWAPRTPLLNRLPALMIARSSPPAGSFQQQSNDPAAGAPSSRQAPPWRGGGGGCGLALGEYVKLVCWNNF